MTETLINTS